MRAKTLCATQWYQNAVDSITPIIPILPKGHSSDIHPRTAYCCPGGAWTGSIGDGTSSSMVCFFDGWMASFRWNDDVLTAVDHHMLHSKIMKTTFQLLIGCDAHSVYTCFWLMVSAKNVFAVCLHRECDGDRSSIIDAAEFSICDCNDQMTKWPITAWYDEERNAMYCLWLQTMRTLLCVPPQAEHHHLLWFGFVEWALFCTFCCSVHST